MLIVSKQVFIILLLRLDLVQFGKQSDCPFHLFNLLRCICSVHLLHGIPSHTVGLHLPDLYLNKDLLVIVVALSGGGGRGAQMERLTEGAGAWERSAGSSRPLSSSSVDLIHSLKVNFVANHAGRLSREEGGQGRGQRPTIWRCRGI